MRSFRRWLSSSMARLTRRRSHQRKAGANSRSTRATAARQTTATASQSGIVTDVAIYSASRDDSASRPVSRVLSGVASATAIPLGRGSLRASSNQPGRRRGSRWGESCLPSRAAPIRSCSRWGLPCRLRCRTRGALLPHRFTLACTSCPAPAVCFLWHFPWGRPRRPLAATVDPWSPDFPPPGLGRKARYPSSGRPADWQGE